MGQSVGLNGILEDSRIIGTSQQEFSHSVLEVLREPLESGRITISLAARQADFPARFQLEGAMNPCPCGFLGHPNNKCRCTPDQVARTIADLAGETTIHTPHIAEAVQYRRFDKS